MVFCTVSFIDILLQISAHSGYTQGIGRKRLGSRIGILMGVIEIREGKKKKLQGKAEFWREESGNAGGELKNTPLSPAAALALCSAYPRGESLRWVWGGSRSVSSGLGVKPVWVLRSCLRAAPGGGVWKHLPRALPGQQFLRTHVLRVRPACEALGLVRCRIPASSLDRLPEPACLGLGPTRTEPTLKHTAV